jgi:hypothetical protein
MLQVMLDTHRFRDDLNVHGTVAIISETPFFHAKNPGFPVIN